MKAEELVEFVYMLRSKDGVRSGVKTALREARREELDIYAGLINAAKKWKAARSGQIDLTRLSNAEHALAEAIRNMPETPDER